MKKLPLIPTVSDFDRDRAHGAGLPSALDNDAYSRIAARMNTRQAKMASWANALRPASYEAGAVPVAPPSEPMQRTAAADGFVRIASLDSVPVGFQRVAAGFYRQGHDIWELRRADDGDGFALVRKREERAVDMRSAANAAGAAYAAGVGTQRSASRQPPVPLMGCPDCGAPIHFSIGAAKSGPAYCSRSGGTGRVGSVRCGFVGKVAWRPTGGLDLYDGRGRFIGQYTADPAMEELDGEPGPMPEPLVEVDGEDPLAVDTDSFELDQAEELFDAHEVMHGREPVYDPDAPLPASMMEVVDTDGDAELLDEDDGDGDYDFIDDEPAEEPEGEEHEGKAPPGREDQVRELKKHKELNPYAVSWASYNKSHGKPSHKPEAAAHCGSSEHGRPGHACTARRTAGEADLWNAKDELAQILQESDHAAACSSSGSCDAAVDAAMRDPAVRAVLDRVPPQELANELREYGAWDDEELADHEANLGRLVWTVANDIKEGAYNFEPEESEMTGGETDLPATPGVPPHEADTAGGPGSGQSVVGTRILAVRKGGVAEGVILKVCPMGDLEADFGEGAEQVPLDMILAPVLEMLGLGEDVEHELEVESEPEDEEPEEDEHEREASITRITTDDL